MKYNRRFRLIRSLFWVVCFSSGASCLYAQDDLMELLEEGNDESRALTASSTFKGTRLINGHSVEIRKKGVLEFIIAHRFGTLNSGAHNLFGLDDANIRLGLDYAITDRLSLGIGRSSFQKVFDGFLKYKLLSQQSGVMPMTLVVYSNMSINSLEWSNPGDNKTTDRFAYSHQLLIARKLNTNTSVQLMPTLVHRNRIPAAQEDNLIYALGIGGRQKLTQSVAITFEYYYQFNNYSPNNQRFRL